MLSIGLIKEKRLGPQVAIACPICKLPHVWATSYEIIETPTVLWVIPVGETVKTVLRCNSCQQESITPHSVAELQQMSPAEIDASLKPQGSTAALVLGIASLILCPMPVINLIPAFITIYLNRRATGIVNVLGFIPLILAIAYNIWFIIAIILEINKRMEELRSGL